jgi:hypothetical protein
MKVFEITVPDYQRIATKVEDKTPLLLRIKQALFGKDEFFPYDTQGEMEFIDEDFEEE